MFAVFQSDIHPRAIAGWPDPVWKIAYRYRCNQLRRRASAESLHFVCPTNSHVGEFAVAIVCEVHVVRDRPRIYYCLLSKRRLRAVHLHFARVLQRDPDLVVLRSDCDIRRKRSRLRNLFDNSMRGHVDGSEFWSETGTNKGVLAVRSKHGHARTVSQFDASYFLHLRRIDN